jgi:hypothetical protein
MILESALEFKHLCVVSFFADELGVRTAFDDLSIFYDNDIVSFFNSLQSVSDNDNGSLFKQPMECLCYLFFTNRIQCTCRFIEEDYFWVFEKDPSYSETLTLSTG